MEEQFLVGVNMRNNSTRQARYEGEGGGGGGERRKGRERGTGTGIGEQEFACLA